MTTQIEVSEFVKMYNEEGVRVLDGSWALDGSDMRKAFGEEHIPGAQFFDIDLVSNQTTKLPHMAPSTTQFAEAMQSLGMKTTDQVVVYDRQGLFSAARVWWTFTLMGHTNVRVLAGGLPAWKAQGLPVSNIVNSPKPSHYSAHLNGEIVIGFNELKAALEHHSSIILDARPEARFSGAAPEPRPGLRSGHMPGAMSLPFTKLISEGRLKPKKDLDLLFDAYGITEKSSIITSCGSGVTAAIISMALCEVGHTQVRLYDGSWAEWGNPENCAPIATGDS